MENAWNVPLATPAPLVLRGLRFDAARPAVMGVINRTPDSFYARARFTELLPGLEALDRLLAEGADIVDVGGVRAGQVGDWVEADEEVERVLPFLRAARERHPEALLSLDTWRSEVATACAEVGIDVINDTWAGADPELAAVAARIGAAYVVSHTGGLPPRTDPVGVSYPPEPDGVVGAVLEGLRRGAELALGAGVPRERVLVDPTLDFGKTTRHSLRVLRSTGQVVGLGFPVLQSLSRKDFVGETLDLGVDDRLEGTLASTAVAAWLGATVFRAHDVRATRRVVDMVASIRGDRPPVLTVRGEPDQAG